MKVGIMQPYFFPYMGYFQLIHAVDVYVNLDHVSFMKRSYMTRNSLKNSTTINLQVSSASQNKTCREVFVSFEHDYLNKFYKTLRNLYSKSPYFDAVMQRLIEPNFFQREVNVSEFNLGLIKTICEILEIKTKIIETSTHYKNSIFKKELGLQGITKELGGKTYINAIGGTKLYDKGNFREAGVDLLFIKTSEMEVENVYDSILHQLMSYPADHLSNQINKYELI
jgi:hypothetical protein